MYEIHGRRIGVRWSRPGLDAALRSLVGIPPESQAAPGNISVVLGETRGRTRSKHRLFVQGKLVAATSEDGSLLRGVIRALASFDEPPSGLLVSGMAVCDEADRLTVVDHRLAPDLRRLEPRLRRASRGVVALPWLVVDASAGVAILPDGLEALKISPVGLNGAWPTGRADDTLVAGRFAISHLVYAGHPEPTSLAAAVADLVPMVRAEDGRVASSDVAVLSQLAEGVRLTAVHMQDRLALRRALEL